MIKGNVIFTSAAFIILTVTGIFSSSPVFAGKIVVGYYPGWVKSSYTAAEIKYENLTHIYHAFAWPDENGNIKYDYNFLNADLNRLAHENDVKVCISLGGWGNSWGFSAMAADSEKRVFFINNLVNFLKDHDYDGVDFDWEYPGSEDDRSNLTKLISELYQRFQSENSDWLITFAVGTGDWKGQWYDYDQLKQYVNWFNAMCYDYHGAWSEHSGHNAPLYQPPGDACGAVNVGMNYLHITRGIPKNQLTVGMPFYGRLFTTNGLYESFTAAEDYFYYQVAPVLNSVDWTYHWDNAANVPYLTNSDNTQLITFDDTVSIGDKCGWIIDEDYLGGMIWALGQDEYNNKQVLLTTVGKYLIDSTATAIKKTVEVPQDFIVCKNYPNPFNPVTNIEFNLPYRARVTIDVYNAAGEIVSRLINNQSNAGKKTVRFDASGFASGVYFYNLKIYSNDMGFKNFTGKMILLK